MKTVQEKNARQVASSVLAGVSHSNADNFVSGLESVVQSHFRTVGEIVGTLHSRTIAEMAHQLNLARIAGRTVFTMGNGGSAATALHFANDLSMAIGKDGLGVNLRVVCLNGNMSLFSALANDIGYDQVFAWQLRSLVQEGDIVVGISASGNSPNCVQGLRCAKERKALTFGFLGFDGGIMKDLCDHYVHVSSFDYLVVEDVHLAIAHGLSYCLRAGNAEQATAAD